MVEIVASAASLIEVKDSTEDDVSVNYSWKFGDGSGGGSLKTDGIYYSDANYCQKDTKEDEGQPWSTYCRVRIYTNIVNGKWKPVEEQEVSLNVREFGCKYCPKNPDMLFCVP